jgi:hypothetical protein
MKTNVPISLFVYNRLSQTKRTIEALRKNHLAKSSELIVISDGPKDDVSKLSVEAVRKYIHTISGFKKVAIIERSSNLGLAKSFILGIDRLIKKHKMLIVLEDDSLTSPYFLQYMNEALNLYKNNPEVFSIHGYMYPIKGKTPESFFLKGADSWGWGTWRRSWKMYERDGKKLLNELQTKNLTNDFDFYGSYPFTRILKDQTAGKNSSWSIRWMATAFLKNKLTLYPGVSLVQNIGFDGSGTHTGKSKIYNVKLAKRPIKLKKIELIENKEMRLRLARYFKSKYKYSFFDQIFERLKNTINKL